MPWIYVEWIFGTIHRIFFVYFFWSYLLLEINISKMIRCEWRIPLWTNAFANFTIKLAWKCAFSEMHFIEKWISIFIRLTVNSALGHHRAKWCAQQSQKDHEPKTRNRLSHAEIKGKKRSMKLLQRTASNGSIVLATVNYGSMIQAVIMCDFGLDDSNQDDPLWFIAK